MTERAGPSDVVAERIRETRQSQGLSTRSLAERCALAGATQITAAVLMNIESGRRDEHGRRRRDVTVDELLAIAAALTVSPSVLLLPEREETPYRITPRLETTAGHVYRWLIGDVAGAYGDDVGDDLLAAAADVASSHRPAWMRPSALGRQIRDEIDRQLNEKLAGMTLEQLVRQST